MFLLFIYCSLFSLYLQYVSLLRPPITDSTAGPGADIIDKVEWKQVKSSKSFHIFSSSSLLLNALQTIEGQKKQTKQYILCPVQPKKYGCAGNEQQSAIKKNIANVGKRPEFFQR